MKGFRRALSVFLVAVFLLSGYIISPATALALSTGKMSSPNVTRGSFNDITLSTSEPSENESAPAS